MTENQKLRDALREVIAYARESGHDWLCLVEAEKALALPTADELKLSDPALQKRLAAQWGFVLPTATPAGERDRFEKWAREQFYSGLACPSDTWSDERKTYSDAAHHMAFCAFKAATQMTEQAAHEEIARLRAENAALSAGDSVDAQRYRLVRRGQHFSVINGIGDTLRGEALDAAIRARGEAV